MPSADLPAQAIQIEMDPFCLLHDANSVHVNGNDIAHIQARESPLTASKLVSRALPPDSLHCNGSSASLNGNGALLPSLKAIPLASYYKLHRVPSLSNMTERASNVVETVQLPRRESTSETPSEDAPQNGIHNKILEHVVRTPGRQPSPQPTHLSVPGSTPNKVLQEEGSGYVAPKFEGKDLQMDQGMGEEVKLHRLDIQLISASI